MVIHFIQICICLQHQEPKENDEFKTVWQQKVRDKRTKFRSTRDTILKNMKKALDDQMKQDKDLLKKGIFETQNNHGMRKKLTRMNYNKKYFIFLQNRFEAEFKGKGASRGKWVDDTVIYHKSKMKRFVMFEMIDYLSDRKDKFFS